VPGQIRIVLRNGLQKAEAALDRAFGPAWNPLRQLGTLGFFFFWIAAVSGIYLYIFFETTAAGAYGSVEQMTRAQWYYNGVARSLHRYSSDAMVGTMALHLVRELILDRYRGVRWYSWFSGVPLIWFLYMSGISGYWLVWDQLAQYVAVASMEWLDWLGIFGESVANNFLTRGSLDDRFFSLLVFMHIFIPLLLLFGMWIHLLRLSRPRVNPPRGLALGSLLMLVALSLAKPALSHPPADLGVVPASLGLDWFYMPFYPLYDLWGAGPLWGLAVGMSLLLGALPWLPPLRKAAPAQVFLEYCNGCARCYDDCPYGAVTLRPRTDGRPFEQQAEVRADFCNACGICVGACPVSTPFRSRDILATGIDLPGSSLDGLHRRMIAALDDLPPRGGGDGQDICRVLVFGCDHGTPVQGLSAPGARGVSLPCIGMLPPSFMDFALSGGGADGVMVAGCPDCGCHHRLGIDWTQQRMDGVRDPYLRKRVSRDRLRAFWGGRADGASLAASVGQFQADLAAMRGAETGHE